MATTTGTVVPSAAGGPGVNSLRHDGDGLMVQWLSEQVQGLPHGARVRVTIQQLQSRDQITANCTRPGCDEPAAVLVGLEHGDFAALCERHTRKTDASPRDGEQP
jgi:hypothetical protein